MEPKLDETSNQNNLLTNFGFLESLLKSHNQPYNKNSMSLDEFFMNLHRIIFSYEDGSKKSYVEKIETFFKIMIKNSIRLKKDSLLFKSVSYFIKNGFNLFINVLQDKKVIKLQEFYDKLLDILEPDKIEKQFKYNEGEVEKALNIIEFKNVMANITFKNKIMCFILFFFRDFIKENDKIIMDDIGIYLKGKNITEFYENYDKIIAEKNKSDNENILESIDKNENKDDLSDNNNGKTKNYPSNNKDKDMTETCFSDDLNLANINLSKELENINSNGKENKSINNEDILDKIKKLSKEIEDLKAKEITSKKEIEDLKKKEITSKQEIEDLKKKVEKIGPMEKNIEELQKKTELLDKKLSYHYK